MCTVCWKINSIFKQFNTLTHLSFFWWSKIFSAYEPEEYQIEPPGYEGSPFQDVAGALVPREEYLPLDEVDPETLRRELEIAEDQEVIEHFRRQIKKADTQKAISEVAGLAESSLPVKSNIPVTTPRLSPSPRRQKSSEKLYEEKEGLPDIGDIPVSEEKDTAMSKLHKQLAAAAGKESDAITISPRRQLEAEIHERVPEARTDGVSDQSQHVTDQIEPTTPIQPGSPGANAIIADFASARAESRYW